MATNCCEAPQSVTNVYNYSLAADQFAMESFTLGATLKATLADLPAAGFILAFLDSVPQRYGVTFMVDYTTGIVTFIGATAGQLAYVVYIKA